MCATPFNTTGRTTLVLLAFCLLFGCGESLSGYTPPQNTSVPVADAWLTNIAGESYVTLSRSVAMIDTITHFPPIQGAEVNIRDTAGYLLARFFEEYPGFYIPTDSSFRGIAGKIYQLNIGIGNKTWSALAQMPNETKIDSAAIIRKATRPRWKFDRYLEIYFSDYIKYRNFYLWEISLDDSIYFSDRIFLSDDRGLNGKKIIYQFPQKIAPQKKVAARIYTITQKANAYYRGIQRLRTRDRFLRITPENPPTNFSEPGILGFFTATTIDDYTMHLSDQN